MLANAVKARLKQNQAAVGTLLDQFWSPVTVRLLANAGFDFLFLDTEHASPDNAELINVIQACRMSGITPIVRPIDKEYPLIARVLDMGAQGIIMPRVESPEQAAQIVRFAKFPPDGVRGFGTFMPLDYESVGLDEAIPFLNEQTLIVVQIETAAAVERVDDILAVEGIDVAFVGPFDLSTSLGVPGQVMHPQVIAAVEKVIGAAQAQDIAVGVFYQTPEDLAFWHARGARFLTCQTVSGMFRRRAAEVNGQIRAAISG